MRYFCKPDAPLPPLSEAREAPWGLTEQESKRILFMAMRAAGERGLTAEDAARIHDEMEDAVLAYVLACGVLEDRLSVAVSEGEVVYLLSPQQRSDGEIADALKARMAAREAARSAAAR